MFMKRKLLSGCLLLFLGQAICFRSEAQWQVGVGAGINKNYLQTDVSNRVFAHYEGVLGITLEVPVQYRVNNWFSLQVAPAYIRKGYKWVRDGFYEGVYQTNTNNYLQLPLITSFSVGGPKLKGFFNLGGYGAWWIGGRVKGTMPNVFLYELPDDLTQEFNNVFQFDKPSSYDEKYHFDSRKDRRFEWGWLAGAGISYQLTANYGIYAEGRYYQSLTDQQKNYSLNQVERYNQTYSIGIGFMRRIGK